MLRYDLHSHTTHSDGTLAPAELVARARAKGIDVLAVTDHDSTEGLIEAETAASQQGLVLVPGVEISVTWEGHTLHLVGLHVDRTHPGLCAGLARLREFRDWRAQEIDRRLAKHRVTGALAGARRFAHGAIVSRTHFARFLVERGYVRSMNLAFKQFLIKGKPGHVPGDWASLAEAVGWIQAAGGQAVIAHPARYKVSAGKLRKLFGEFRELGGDAIEVISGNHDPQANSHFAQLAQEFGFRASIGSDYHGPEVATNQDRPWADLGKLPALPEGCVPVWEAWELKAPSLKQQA